MSNELIFILGAAGIIGFVILGFAGNAQMAKAKDELKDRLGALPGFCPSQIILKSAEITSNKQNGIAVDNESKQIALILKDEPKLYRFEDVIACEAIIDGQTITKSARMNQLGKAALGGLLFGGAGAIVGALGGRKEEYKKVKQVSLKLLLDDLENPTFIINFAEFGNPKPMNEVAKEAQQWNDLFKVIISHADREAHARTAESA